ncbi:MAG: hypothetical protein MUF06_22700 [Pirellulaceae bacterium]|nr:hypothetical protein [Pirellulaceae bacterium]
MDQHRLSRRLDWAVGAGVAMLHAIGVATWFRDSNAWLALALRDSVPIVWLVLIPTWAVLGTGRVWLRWPAAMGLLAVWGAIYSGEFFGGGLPFVPPILFTIVIVALVCSAVTRVSGLQLRGASPDDLSLTPQFSIRSILIATALVAVTIAALKWLEPRLAYDPLGDRYGIARDLAIRSENLLTGGTVEVMRGVFPRNNRELFLAVAMASVALGGLWSVLRPGPVWLRLTTLALAIPILAAYMSAAGRMDSTERFGQTGELAMALASYAALAAVTALPLRLFDYRLMRAAAAVQIAKRGIYVVDKVTSTEKPSQPIAETSP